MIYKELSWIVEGAMTRENLCARGVQTDFFSLNAFHSCLVEAMHKEHGDTMAAYTGLDFAVQN